MPPKTMIKWDAEQDQKLLLAILATCDHLDFKKVAEEFGSNITPNAINKHIKRLRELQAKGAAVDGETTDKTVGGATKAKTKGKTSAAARKRANSTDDEDVKANNHDSASPDKKVKVKAEPENDEW